jgi:hypothetical protein
MGNSGASSAPSGTSGQGTVVRRFPFAFDTPGLRTGAALYTPTVGDILLDAWVEITTPWNGTSPSGDWGTYTVGDRGQFLTSVGDSLDMTNADFVTTDFSNLLIGTQSSDLAALFTEYVPTGNQGDGTYMVSGTNVNFVATPVRSGSRPLPGRFVNTNPLMFVVSQDGTNTGADPGSTQGTAALYLVTATPV